MKIRSKLAVSFFVIILFFLITTGIILITTISNNTILTKINEKTLKETLRLLELQENVTKIRYGLTDMSATRGAPGYDDGFDYAKEHYEKSISIIEQFINIYQNTDKIELFKNIKTYLMSSYDIGKRMTDGYIKGGPDFGNPLRATVEKFAKKYRDQVDEIVGAFKTELINALNHVMTQFYGVLIMSIIITVVAIIISISLSVRISYSISSQLSVILGITGNLAIGDLTKKAHITSKDEFGILTKNLNASIDSVKNIITKAQEASFQSKDISNSLSNEMKNVVSSITVIAESINSINKQFEVMNDNILSSSSSLEQMNSIITRLGDRIKDQAN